MGKFKYEIAVVEEEKITRWGTIYWPTAPTVRRRPVGYRRAFSIYQAAQNRRLAGQQLRSRPNPLLRKLKNKLDKAGASYLITSDWREWRGSIVQFCIIEGTTK